MHFEWNSQAETAFNEHSLVYGFEHIKYETQYNANQVLAPDAEPGTEPSSSSSGEDAQNQALYAEGRLHFDKLSLIPGLRYNQSKLNSAVIEDSFSKVTAAFAAEYQFTPAVLVRASSTQLFKAPEIGEVFTGAGLRDTANPGIEAETGLNNELAVAVDHNGVYSGVTFFDTTIKGYIYDYAPPPAGRYWKDNVGDMSIWGYEFYLGKTFDDLDILLTYSVSDSELDAYGEYQDFDNARIDRKQGDTLSLNVDYHISNSDLHLHWDVLWVDDLEAGKDLDGPNYDNAKDGFVVHNISARWLADRYVKGLAVNFGIDNVLDEYYSSQSSRVGQTNHPVTGLLELTDFEPGRNIKATVSYQF